NQNIDTNRGLIPIKNVCVGDEVLTRDGYKRVLNACYTGYKPLKKIEYAGTNVLITPEHKILTDEGWKECQDVKVGDVVAWMTYNEYNCNNVDNKLAKIIGWLIGDGSLCTHNVQL